MIDITKGIVIAVVSAGIMAFVGYLTVIKDNQNHVEALIQRIDTLEQRSKNILQAMNATKLFIAQAHPKEDIILLSNLLSGVERPDSPKSQPGDKQNTSNAIGGPTHVIQIPATMDADPRP